MTLYLKKYISTSTEDGVLRPTRNTQDNGPVAKKVTICQNLRAVDATIGNFVSFPPLAA